MSSQDIINVVGGGFLLTLGWLGRQLWDAVATLKADIKQIEINLPTNYSTKSDTQSSFDKLEHLLIRVLDKLDGKQDKSQ